MKSFNGTKPFEARNNPYTNILYNRYFFKKSSLIFTVYYIYDTNNEGSVDKIYVCPSIIIERLTYNNL